MNESTGNRKRLPHWMKMQRASGESYTRLKNLVYRHHLHTICTSGKCPNIGECWNRGTATFMILGNICTRRCKFCSVPTGKPHPVDHEEPARVADSVRLLGIRHCVITSVDRDDLKDLGVSIWVETIRKIKEINPLVTIEVLIPDFQGRKDLVQQIIAERPEVISHNLETVERLTPKIRSKAKYNISLDVLRFIASTGAVTKSGIMLGLGETRDEVLATMDDLLLAGVKIITIGQYLQPTLEHMQAAEYIHPEIFENYRLTGLSKGFAFVESGPLVRSSYNAEKHLLK
jgi:lipoic acid synthetase